MTATKTATEAAWWYHSLGANVLPIEEGVKRPPKESGWQRWGNGKDGNPPARQTTADVERLTFHNRLAIILGEGGFSCIDFDGKEDGGGSDLPVEVPTVRMVVSALGLDFDTYPWLVRTPSGGYHLWLRTEGIASQTFKSEAGAISDLHPSLKALEWKARGAITLIPPTPDYVFVNSEPVEAPVWVDREKLSTALRMVLRDGVSVFGSKVAKTYHGGTNTPKNERIGGDLVKYLCEYLKTEYPTPRAVTKTATGEYEVRLAEGEGHGGYHVLLNDREDLSSGYAWNCFRDAYGENGEAIGGGKIGGGWPDAVAIARYDKLYKKGTPLSTLTTAERRKVEAEVKKLTGRTPKEIRALHAEENGTPSPTEGTGSSGPYVRSKEGKKTNPEYLREWVSERGIRVRYNELKYRVEYNDSTGASDGERWDAIQGADLCEWASDYEDYTRKSIAPGRLGDYLTAEGMKNKYDPVRSFFDDLPKWDGSTNHIAELARFLPMENPVEWEKHLTKWMMGAYACGYYTAEAGGYKNELFLILHGSQGVGKTFFVENLIPKKLHAYMFSGTVSDDKDSMLTQSQHWILNHEELESLRRVDQTHIKKLLSARDLTVRPPYGRVEETRPRRISFIGSTNEHSFLTDDTGSRRYLIHSVSGEGITAEDRERFKLFDVRRAWAQAKAYHEEPKYGWVHYLSKEEEKEAGMLNKKHEYERPEDYVVKRYVDLSPYGEYETLSASEVMARLETIMDENDRRVANMDKSFHIRIGRALIKAGVVRKKVRAGSDTAWKYAIRFRSAEERRLDFIGGEVPF